MLKYILAAATALTVANSAQSATVMAGSFLNGVNIYQSPAIPAMGASCNVATQAFAGGMIKAGTQFAIPLTYSKTENKIKHYYGTTTKGVNIVVLCLEDRDL